MWTQFHHGDAEFFSHAREGEGFRLRLEKATADGLNYGGGLLGYFLLQYRCQSKYLGGRLLSCVCPR